MIDTHCHLTDRRLLEQLDGVLERSAAAGVDEMVTVGTHPADWSAAIELAHAHANIRCAVGGHPNNCGEFEFARLGELRAYCDDDAVVALGEMGLDYHYGFAERDRQKKYFEAQLQLARETGFPVIIHCREATEDCLAILGNFPSVPAVFHCFTGSREEAGRIWDAGYLTGFTGVVTFKNGEALREVARAAPADRILVETDAPYLTPEPMRKQKINEPAMVVHTAAAVAAARNLTAAELDALTTANALRFYRWRGRGISPAC